MGSAKVIFLCFLIIVKLSCQLVNCNNSTKTEFVNPTNSSSSSTTKAPTPPKTNEVINNFSEGGPVKNQPIDTTHLGREHTYEKSSPVIVPDPNNSTNKTSANSSLDKLAKFEPLIKTQPFVVAEKNDDKTSVGKKGVTYPYTYPASSTTTTTTTKPKMSEKIRPKKPTITEAGDDTPFVSSNLIDATKLNDTKSSLPKPEIPSIEVVTESKKQRQADYVVPIVAVILSVPLVAIIISVLYKRGAEWWQHRHYRRMDFLIEGMYNN